MTKSPFLTSVAAVRVGRTSVLAERDDAVKRELCALGQNRILQLGREFIFGDSLAYQGQDLLKDLVGDLLRSFNRADFRSRLDDAKLCRNSATRHKHKVVLVCASGDLNIRRIIQPRIERHTFCAALYDYLERVGRKPAVDNFELFADSARRLFCIACVGEIDGSVPRDDYDAICVVVTAEIGHIRGVRDNRRVDVQSIQKLVKYAHIEIVPQSRKKVYKMR